MSTCDRMQANTKLCNCTYGGCPRHGKCCECLHYHRAMKQLPACYFDTQAEATYNRSISYFVQQHSP